MRLLTTLTLIAICLTAIRQTCPAKNDSWFRVDTLIANFASNKKMDDGQNTLNSYSWDIHTEIKYTYSTGKVVTIQNSGPRGGRGFTDATGIRFGYRVYCTRVVNEADTPLELTITFPADSFPLPSPDWRFRGAWPRHFAQRDQQKFSRNSLLTFKHILFVIRVPHDILLRNGLTQLAKTNDQLLTKWSGQRPRNFHLIWNLILQFYLKTANSGRVAMNSVLNLHQLTRSHSSQKVDNSFLVNRSMQEVLPARTINFFQLY